MFHLSEEGVGSDCRIGASAGLTVPSSQMLKKIHTQSINICPRPNNSPKRGQVLWRTRGFAAPTPCAEVPGTMLPAPSSREKQSSLVGSSVPK